MSRSASLLENVQWILERTYASFGGIDIAQFLIGDEGFRQLYADREVQTAGSPHGLARMFIREQNGAVHAMVYLPDSMVRRLEDNPPQRGLNDFNVDDFATLVEEIDHLLLLVDRVRSGRSVTLLEMEWNANVSKYLVLSRFLAGSRGKLTPDRRLWLRRHLFCDVRYTDPDPAIRERYRSAARLAVQFIDRVGSLPAGQQLAALRAFYRADMAGRQSLLSGV